MADEWRFSQCFGEKVEELTEADILSAVEFDDTGEFLATGDKGGRIVLFKRGTDGRSGAGAGGESLIYNFYADFQSHEAEFDYLKSLEIEEKINRIRWCPSSFNSQFLLSTNDKTVKLWKIRDREARAASVMRPTAAMTDGAAAASQLRLPTVEAQPAGVVATPRRVYANAHAYHINSIALNSDGETFFSADDLRINLWNLGISDQSFTIVDIKPANMEELTEVITAAEFHPSHCNVLIYSSSKGTIRLADMRASALCDNHTKLFEEEEDAVQKSFFSEIIASISDVKFSPDGRYIISRDYMTLKLWDVNMENRPVKTIPIHDVLRPKLCELYENDCIFDKFECAVSPDGNSVVTGSYDHNFHIFDRFGKSNTVIEATQVPNKRRMKVPRGAKRSGREDANSIDFAKKMLHLAWHPTQNLIAACAMNNLYIYSA